MEVYRVSRNKNLIIPKYIVTLLNAQSIFNLEVTFGHLLNILCLEYDLQLRPPEQKQCAAVSTHLLFNTDPPHLKSDIGYKLIKGQSLSKNSI